jgi:putative ABC transport system permease protein
VILIAAFAVVYCALGVIAWRRPLLARMAFREAVRRPWQSALVVAGLTVGTSMILMSLVNTDSIATTLTHATYQSWGRVDLLVSANGAFFSPDIARGLAESPSLQGRVRGVQAGVELVGTVADLDRRLDNPTVRLIGLDPAAQPSFGAYTLDDGSTTFGEGLGSGDVLLSQSLATSIQAQSGDTLQVASGGFAPVEFKVAGVARADGPGDYGGQPAIFATLAGFSKLTGDDRINVIRISAPGDGEQELRSSESIASQVTIALSDLTSGADLRVRTAKADDVNEITREAAQAGPTTLALSLIVVLAGIALVANLALALAEERRPQLAVSRALGLSRSGLVITSVLEGGLYSAGAAAIGAFPGIATGWLLVSHARLFVPEINEKSATLLFIVSPQTIATSIAAGALVTLITFLAASVRTSRLTIASAVRALPDPPTARRPGSLRSAGIAAAGIAGLSSAVLGNAELRLVGGLVLIAALGSALRGHLPNRARVTLISVAAATWVVAFLSTLSAYQMEVDPWSTVLGLACLVVALSALVAANMRMVERFIPRALVAQLTRRPLRLSLATAALGLVFATLSFLGGFIASTSPDYSKDAGGYDVSISSMTTSSISLSPDLQSKVQAEMAIGTTTYFGPVQSSSSDRGPGPLPWHQQLLPLFALDDSQLFSGALPLSSHDARFPSDAAVWAALRSDPHLVLSGLYQPGTTVDLVGSNGPVERLVVASFQSGFLPGLVGSTDALAPVSSGIGGTSLLVRLKPGVDASSFAIDVRRSMFPTGVEASTMRDLLDQGGAIFRNFAAESELMLSAGIAVGVLSLGVLALRAVIERRRSIGLLRAVGFQPRVLMTAVIGEALLTAVAGIAVGAASGLILAYLFVTAAYPGAPFRFQMLNFAAAAALALLTTLAVTAIPALAVARTAPAQALRLID